MERIEVEISGAVESRMIEAEVLRSYKMGEGYGGIGGSDLICPYCGSRANFVFAVTNPQKTLHKCRKHGYFSLSERRN